MSIRLLKIDLTGIDILLVEDNDDLCFLMSRYLSLAGAKVDIAKDGAGATAQISNNTYQVILMDLRLPDISGLDIVKNMREAGNITPVLAVSAHGRDVFGGELINFGFDGYLSKPATEQQVVTAVANLLKT